MPLSILFKLYFGSQCTYPCFPHNILFKPLSVFIPLSPLPFLTHQRYIVVENIVRKGDIACKKQFLLFSQCFLPYMVLIFHFKCTLTLYSILILTHKQQTAFENIVGKGEIARYDCCFLLNQIIVSPFVHIFDIISVFAAEFGRAQNWHIR